VADTLELTQRLEKAVLADIGRSLPEGISVACRLHHSAINHCGGNEQACPAVHQNSEQARQELDEAHRKADRYASQGRRRGTATWNRGARRAERGAADRVEKLADAISPPLRLHQEFVTLLILGSHDWRRRPT
jgi:hypothetical protein